MSAFRFALARATICLAVGVLLYIAAAPAVGQTPAKRYAVLVGVKEYKHEKLPALKYSENDVVDLARVLRDAGYTVTLLCDSAGKKNSKLIPDKANIERTIKDVLFRSERGDTVIIAFAGHGLQFAKQKDAYFCPVDARPFAESADSLVSLGRLYQELDDSFADVKVLLVDACRNDPAADRGARGIDADSAPRPPSGVAALFSCRAGERAFEHPKYQHGVFFHHLLKGLEGEAQNKKGNVTFASLAEYVQEQVSADVPKLIGDGAKQSPNMKADLSGPSATLIAKPAAPAKVPAGKGALTELGGLRSTAPATWRVKEATGNKFRTHEFMLPRADADKEDAELVVLYLAGGGGGTEANIKRWKDGMAAPLGKSIDDVTKVTEFKVGDVPITYVEISGTYLYKFPPASPNAKVTPKENFRFIGVVFDSKDGPFFIKLAGPALTVQAHKGDFDAWLKAFK
jgi:hypothetical protein